VLWFGFIYVVGEKTVQVLECFDEHECAKGRFWIMKLVESLLYGQDVLESE
jgi:hypothetical protein